MSRLVAGLVVLALATLWLAGCTSTQVVTETESIPHRTVERKNGSLAEGERQTKQDGMPGTKTHTYEVDYKDGEEVARRLVSTEVTVKPVDEIVLVGTKKTSSTASQGAAPSGAGGSFQMEGAEVSITGVVRSPNINGQAGDYLVITFLVDNDNGRAPLGFPDTLGERGPVLLWGGEWSVEEIGYWSDPEGNVWSGEVRLGQVPDRLYLKIGERGTIDVFYDLNIGSVKRNEAIKGLGDLRLFMSRGGIRSGNWVSLNDTVYVDAPMSGLWSRPIE